MPSEMRQIMFRGAETMSAITEYYKRRNMTLPPGNMVKVSILDEPEISAQIEVRNDSNETTEFVVNGEMLAAALILYCINRKIPLPAEADKRLQKVNHENIALLVVKRAR